MRALLSTRPGRLIAAGLGALALVVAVAMAILWPSGDHGIEAITAGGTDQAKVRAVARLACPLSEREPCQRLTLEMRSGADEGTQQTLTMPGTDFAPAFAPGDTIRVRRNDAFLPEGTPTAPSADAAVENYSFADYERRTPLYVLAAIFAFLVVLLGRRKGALSLVGLVASLAVVTQFMVPAVLDGSAPLLVALVGSLAVMFLTLALAHGLGAKSAAAALGASASLLATALLALLFLELAQITGFASEEATLLRGSASAGGTSLSLEGLVLAGIVVGALGVLDDVTVSQASTVMALRRANPAQSFARLVRGGLDVGRDHLSATVNTLVLAYVGAALPILLIFENQGTSFGDAINFETVAGEIVAMLVGSIGLILAMPLTTVLAAWLAGQLPREALPDEHAHAH